jgi:hypothetical protein
MHARTPPPRFLSATQADGFVDDHKRAIAVVGSLRTATDPGTVRAALEDAAAFIEPHMAEEEEADGVFQWLRALEPSLTDEVNRLRAEHDEIRSLLANALQASDSDLAAHAAALATRLEAHEAAERAALQTAMS